MNHFIVYLAHPTAVILEEKKAIHNVCHTQRNEYAFVRACIDVIAIAIRLCIQQWTLNVYHSR